MIEQAVLAEHALTNGTLRAAVLRYYRRYGRDLPWRAERAPYRIWVSETMLQQTQVVTVTKRYQDFIKTFPSVRALAAAPVERVCEAWAGLGYYSRAKNLHAAAKMIVARHGGRLPATAADLQALPGVGRYTAGAVASIGFGEAIPAVDGNVARFLVRLFGIDEPPARAACARRLWAIAGALVAHSESPGELNQALMDLGACVCTPRAPRCDSCPAKRWCVARASGRAEALPRRATPRPARPELAVAFAWIEDSRGLWLERRPETGLWAGQWQLPCEHGPSARARLARRLGVELGRNLATIRHELTHRRVRASIFDARVTEALRSKRDFRRFAHADEAPVTGLARRAISAVLGRRSSH